jgi:hypothetical protein
LVEARPVGGLLGGIEEMDEPVPYATLRLIAGGLDCEPVELARETVPD